jgi:hypothetical protein
MSEIFDRAVDALEAQMGSDDNMPADLVLAVITSMRYPTEDMAREANKSTSVGVLTAIVTWRYMIDAALK